MSQWLKIDNVRKILSPSSSHLLLAKTNAPCSAISHAIAEHLVMYECHIAVGTAQRNEITS